MSKANSSKGVFINNLMVLGCCLLITGLSYSANVWSAVRLDLLKDDQADVIELMRLETAQALRQHTDLTSAATNSTMYSAQLNQLAGNNIPALKALYGVGHKITAEVQMGDQTLKYINGSQVPLGLSKKSAPLLLISIDGICVTLSDKDKPYELCLNTR